MYTPLYIRTDNSLQKSIIKIPDLINYAIKNNIKSLTITDNNMYGVMDFYVLCKKNNIKPIIGLEVTFDNSIFILYCMNYDGYKNLIKICTKVSEESLKLEDIEKYSDNLICIIPFKYKELYIELKKVYKYTFIGYKNSAEYEDISDNNKVYINETCSLDKKDTKYLKYLEGIREGIIYPLVTNNYSDNYILSEDEFKDKYKESVENNYLITDLCNIEIPFNQDLMPKYINEEGIDSYSYIKKKCIEGLKKHFGSSVKGIYKDRLKYELDIINKMGFCDYFLIVSDYVKYAKENNIIVGSGRGSAVGSLVSYCLMITDVDPIKYDLLFERFLNPERVSMPDIDIDFEHIKREDVINYCIDKYGKKRVVPIITFGTLGAKQAIRDVAKTMDIDISIVDGICKLIDSNKSLVENYNTNKKIKNLLDRKDKLKEVYKVATKLEGLKRHTSIHAAGIVMSKFDLDEVIPLDKSHDFYVSGYDMTYLEDIGLLKMDFLAIKYLTIIHNIIDNVNEKYNLNIAFDNISLNDKDALDLFNRANTIGIFQFESEGMINFLNKLKVTSMDDLFAAIALFRPGPMQNIPTYIRRKEGKEKVDYIDSSLEDILKPTYGIMIYQEQIMQIARKMAGYTLGEADMLRKAMSKKKQDILLNEKEKFKTRALNLGYNSHIIDKVYDSMLKFASYGFNKSHSVAYSIIAYKMAYLKSHYPDIFITYLLSEETHDESKLKKYIYEAKKYNINILMPDINRSEKKYKLEADGIRYPLTRIKNLGMGATDTIINERQNGEFIDIYDFISRCYGKSVNKKTIESLIKAGVFSSFGYNKKTLINNLDVIINYGELIKDLSREYAIEPEIMKYEEYSNKELMEHELEVFGLFLTYNPITNLKQKYRNIIDLNNINNYFDKNISVIVHIDNIKVVKTSKNEEMCFISGSDEITTVDIVLFPKNYNKFKDIKKGDIIKILGKVEKRYDKYQIVVNSLEVINL